MKNLVDEKGLVKFGIYDEPIDHINYLDYPLETPMGLEIPRWWRRIKANQFAFVGIIGPEYIIGMAVVDLHYAANGFLYVYDKKNNEMKETSKLAPSLKNIFIEPYPDKLKARFSMGKFKIDMDAGKVKAQGKDLDLDFDLDLKNAKPLRICTRAGYRDWVYVEKTNPIKVSGKMVLGGKTIDISSPAYMAAIDWTCGYMRRKTCWNWASISGTLPDSRSFGLNLSCGVNETSFTENFFMVDGKRTKVDTVNFVFDNKDLFKPWHITSFDKKVDLSFFPEKHRGEKISAFLIASRFTQLMGIYEGSIETDSGEVISIAGLPGFAEDHYAKW